MEEERLRQEESLRRIEERRRQLEEEEERLACAKTAQAFFERNKPLNAETPKIAPYVTDAKDKLNRRNGTCAQDEVMNMLAEVSNEPLMAKSASGVELFTRGKTSAAKSAFESKNSAPVKPLRSRTAGSNLPNMFQQKERRDALFQKDKQLSSR